MTLDTAIKCLSQLVSDISISYRWKLSDSAMCPAPSVSFLVNYLKTQWQHTVINCLLQLLQEWVEIIFKDSFMFQIVRMWDGFRPNQTGEQAKTLSDEFWTAIKARSKPRTDVFLKVSTEGSTTMSFFVSYLPRLWRRRPTVICKWSKYLWNFAVLSQIL